MYEPDLVQRQREILRAFRQATAQRAQEETGAESHRQAEKRAAEASLSRAQESAADQLAQVHKAQEEAEDILAEVELEHLLEDSKPPSSVAGPDADPVVGLARSVSVAAQVPENLDTSIEALEAWWKARTKRRRLLVGLALFVVTVVVLLGYSDYQRSQKERLYRPALVALEAGQWEASRERLQQLFRLDRNYKDSQTLLRESYYQPAVKSLDAGRWDEARTLLEDLINKYGTYKDSQTLLRESYYQPAITSLEAGQWEEAREELEALLSVDDRYKDAQDLLRESYYRPAVAAIDAEQWDDAAKIIVQLNHLIPFYRDVEILITTNPGLSQAIITHYGILWLENEAVLMHTLSGHTGWVMTVAFSPDGTLLASGGWDGSIKLWNVASGQELRALTAHRQRENNSMLSVIFSHNGRFLASGSFHKGVNVWDVASNQQEPMLNVTFYLGRVPVVAFSPDDEILAVVVRSPPWGGVKLLGMIDGEELNSLKTGGGANDLAFSPSGQMLVVGIEYGPLKVWDVTNGKQINVEVYGVSSVAFSPDGRLLALGTDENTVDLWNVATWEKLHTLGEHNNTVASLAFSPDGRLLASGSGKDHGYGSGNSIKLWDVENRREVLTLDTGLNKIDGLAFSPDGRRLAAAVHDGTVKIWGIE